MTDAYMYTSSVFPMLGLFLRCSLTVVAMLMTSFLIWCQVISYVTNWWSHDFFQKPKAWALDAYGFCVPGIVGGLRMAPGKCNQFCANLIKQYPFCFMCCVVLFQLLFVGRIFRGSITQMNSFAGILTLTFTQYQTVSNSHRHKYP